MTERNKKVFQVLNYIPFLFSLLYLILYSILLIGATFGHIWFDTSTDIFAKYYREYVFYTFENYGYFMDFPLLLLILILLMKYFKKPIFLFYLSLILILIDFYLGGFCMSYWNPHY